MLKIKIKFGLVAFLAIIAASPALAASKSIKLTKHNLSNWSPYALYVKGNTTQVCVFCHAPHNADSSQAPLWNRKDTTSTFDIKSTIHVKPDKGVGNPGYVGQPDGISKKCLSCHDGTVSIGAVVNVGTSGLTEDMGLDIDNGTRVDVLGKLRTPSPNNLGTNLTGGHVISFVYNQTLVNTINNDPPIQTRFNDAVNVPRSWLDRASKMQCHTCHDPHTDKCNDSAQKIGRDPFWRITCATSTGNGSLCERCHSASYDYYTSPKIGF